MLENPRKFEAGTDPFGRKWRAELRWLQNAISIRHADAVDVKWELTSDDGEVVEKVVALYHPDLLALSQKEGRTLSDSWCIRLAAEHIRALVSTWEDAEKTILVPSREQLQAYSSVAVPAKSAR
jgi:hypothetical protein